MSIEKTKKGKIISDFGRAPNDTGSPEVQIAVLTERIKALTEHLKMHKKDVSSKYGMMRMVSQRRRLLDYIKKIDVKKYEDLIAKLGIRK